MGEGWWDVGAIEATKSLVNRMAEAVSGRQWDTFNGGRSGKLWTAVGYLYEGQWQNVLS